MVSDSGCAGADGGPNSVGSPAPEGIELDARGGLPVSNNGLRGVPVALSEEGVRISVGSLEPKYVDSSGRVWVGDRYFTGGHT